jgi:hypothetical protein
MIADCQTSAIIFPMNNRRRKTLAALLADPGNGNLDGSKIKELLLALGCRLIEGPGYAVTCVYSGRRANFHRPHPANEAPRYRVKAARESLKKIGVEP